MYKKCLYCGKRFLKPPSDSFHTWIKIRKFCSKLCADTSRRGKRMKHDKQFPKGHVPWNKGLKQPVPEEKHYAYKGDKVSYSGLHHWVKKHLGSPNICEHCGKSGFSSRQIDWANKSRKYKRDLKDWIRLCRKCHEKYDIGKKRKRM